MENLKQNVNKNKNVIIGIAMLIIGILLGMVAGAAIASRMSHNRFYGRDGGMMMQMKRGDYRTQNGQNFNPGDNRQRPSPMPITNTQNGSPAPESTALPPITGTTTNQ